MLLPSVEYRSISRPTIFAVLGVVIACAWLIGDGSLAIGQDTRSRHPDAAKWYAAEIQPLLDRYCFDCHGRGASEGKLTLDNLGSATPVADEAQTWWKVTKNLRAGVMPPVGEARPTEAELQRISNWIKFGAWRIRPDDPDPGRQVIRRLNRAEYANTIRDLMGIEFDAELAFPPDDSGHGFDNIGDAMSFSPLLLEKYLQAAQTIVAEAVPRVGKIVPRQVVHGSEFTGSKHRDGRLDGKHPASIHREVTLDESGTYRVELTVKLHGSFDFDPARYRVTFRLDGQNRLEQEYGWDENKQLRFDYRETWEAGPHQLELTLEPVPRAEPDGGESADGPGGATTSVSFELSQVVIEGPQGTDRLVAPPNYARFFPRPEAPTDSAERRAYATELLQRFAVRAYRGQVSPATVDRLVAIAEKRYDQPGATFEEGIGQAMIAVLASPRFLFRTDAPLEVSDGPQYVLVDELSLASRLSYFLWSTMPDEELFRLAEAGRLRSELETQVKRMLNDPRSNALIQNFVGQWLRTRDVTQVSVDPIVVLGYQQEFEQLRERFRGRFRRRGPDAEPLSPEEQKMRDRLRELREIADKFDGQLRQAMRRETEMCFEHIVREDRSLLELIDADYTFLNGRLAELYGIPDVTGDEMRRVTLPAGSPRGGVLSQASMLLITSNPTRTSPVKRGLFVLDNILGTPAPPAPAGVPDLEESGKRFGDREPSLRELLAVHRESALCSSCHSRMDPLGLALENFNALGMWRETDKDQPINASGRLITGEQFQDVRELKKILTGPRADDFYRCVAQKLLTYAIGRGLEYTDEHTVDLIVDRMKADDGKFSALLMGVVESAPFQKQRLESPSSPVAASTVSGE